MTSEEYKLKLGDKVEIGGDLWVWERVRRGVEATLRRDGAEDDWLVISMPELIGFAGTARRQSSTPLRPTAGDWPADVLDMESTCSRSSAACQWTRTRSGRVRGTTSPKRRRSSASLRRSLSWLGPRLRAAAKRCSTTGRSTSRRASPGWMLGCTRRVRNGW